MVLKGAHLVRAISCVRESVCFLFLHSLIYKELIVKMFYILWFFDPETKAQRDFR